MDLAHQYDLVVLGTGLVESIIAAYVRRAASKTGKSVLQLDPGQHYGAGWATLAWREFVGWVRDAGAGVCRDVEVLGDDADLVARSREYGVDLAPRLCFGAGPAVDALLASGAHHHTEFKLVSASYLVDARDGLLPVPATRAEVFDSRALGLADKRGLMRCLAGMTALLEGEGPGARPDAAAAGPASAASLDDFMTQSRLTKPLLRQMATHGVLLLEDAAACTAPEAAARLSLLQASAGRYGAGASPLLCPMHGVGELAQAFARVAAVHGAVQMLRCPGVGWKRGDPGSSRALESRATGKAEEAPASGAGETRQALEGKGTDTERAQAPFTVCFDAEASDGSTPPRTLVGAGAVVGGADLLARLSEGPGLSDSPPSLAPPAPTAEPRRASLASVSTSTTAVHRMVAVLDAPDLFTAGPSQSVVVAPPVPGRGVVWGLCVGAGLAVCPRDRCLLYLWTKADGAEATSARTALEPVCDSILASAQELRNAREREERAGCADAGEPDQAPSGKAVTRVFYTSEDAPGGTLAASSGPIACPGPGAGVLLDDAITDAKGVYARAFGAGFPFDPPPEDPGDADVASDDEAVELLQSALKGVEQARAKEQAGTKLETAGEGDAEQATTEQGPDEGPAGAQT